jgi:hypothetical protein
MQIPLRQIGIDNLIYIMIPSKYMQVVLKVRESEIKNIKRMGEGEGE